VVYGLTVGIRGGRRGAHRWMHISRRLGGTMIGCLDWRKLIEDLFGGVQL
jgi:hypothetical protein